MDAVAPETTPEASRMTDQQGAPVAKALFVRLTAKQGKGDQVESFLRDGLAAVMEEHDTTTWYAVRFGHHDFAISDTFPGELGASRPSRGQGGTRPDRTHPHAIRGRAQYRARPGTGLQAAQRQRPSERLMPDACEHGRAALPAAVDGA